MENNSEMSSSGQVKGERRRIKNHRSQGMKKLSRMTRNKNRLLTALMYLLLFVALVMAGYTFLFTPGSFSGD